MRSERFKYKGKHINIYYSENRNVEWYAIKHFGEIVIYLYSKYNKKEKSKILHKSIKGL